MSKLLKAGSTLISWRCHGAYARQLEARGVMETFFSKEDCRSYLAELVGGERIDSVLADAVANALAGELRAAPPAGPVDSFEIKLGRWVLRDEDLHALDALRDGALLYLSLNAAGRISPSAVAFTVALARFIWSLYRRGVSLKGDQLLAFTALRQAERGASPAALCAALGKGWTAERLLPLLRSLTAVAARGGPVELATELPDGGWVACA